MNCYLIDNNGFILVSEDYTQVSKDALPSSVKVEQMALGLGWGQTLELRWEMMVYKRQ